LLLLGALLAGMIKVSAELIMGITVGILIFAGLLGMLVGIAVLIGWDAEIRGQKIANYIRIGLGLVALIFAIILLILPATLPAVFQTPEGAIWAIINPLLIFIGANLILVGGIFSKFIIKE